jgi:DNA-binding CsgD family transcriptional regulator
MRGYFTEGRRWLGLALAQPTGSSASRTKALYGAGFLAHIQREPAIARALLEESLVLARSTENVWAEAWVLHVLGRVAYFDEDTASARALGRQSLRLAESVGDRHLIAWAFHLLGLTEHIDAHYDLADQLYERSVAIRRGLGYVEGIAIVQCLRGMIAHRRGDTVAAQELYRESLRIDRTLGTSWRLGQTVALLAGLTVKQQPDRAVRLMSAATAVFEHVQTPWVPLAEALVANDMHLARLALGEASLAAAQAQGQALSFDDALSEALTLEEPAAVIAPTDLGGLTPTEAQVLRLLAAGRTTKQIGAELYLAVSTVERHITHVYDKIGGRGKAAATAFALSHDLIQPSDVGRNERLRQD